MQREARLRDQVPSSSAFRKRQRDVCRKARVDIVDVVIEECVLDSADAPLVVGCDAAVTVKSSRFLRNANSRGASSIKAMTGSSVTIEDSEFRDNRGELGNVILSDASSLTVRNSTFANNSASNSERGGGVFRIQVCFALWCASRACLPLMVRVRRFGRR